MKSQSYVRTMPSTLRKFKKVAVNLTPKFAIADVGEDLMTASSAGSIPRNRQQVKTCVVIGRKIHALDLELRRKTHSSQ